MTRRTSKRPASFAVAILLALGLTPGHAAPLFNPQQNVSLNFPYYSYNTGIIFDHSQNDKHATIKSYDISIPAGWHFAANAIDQSTQASCNDLTATNIETSAERLGETIIQLANDDTRVTPGPAIFYGFLYFLKYDTPTQTATLCGRLTIGNSPIPAANREIMFQVLLKLNGDGSGSMTWNYAAVPGAAAGTRSIYDNTYFQTKNTSIQYTRVSFQSLTFANYNKNPDGTKAPIRFSRSPDVPGTYSFVGTYTPCGTGDPGFCLSPATPIVRTTNIRITDYPVGFHPPAKFVAPAFWAVVTGPAPAPIKWSQPALPAASNETGIRGYALSISADYVANSKKGIYVITDPADLQVASPNPCGTDGAAATCTYELALPYTSDSNSVVPANANYSANLVTIFKDGHRSDGRCDNGTAAGAEAPCIDGTVPQQVVRQIVQNNNVTYAPDGIQYTQFMYRTKAWPLRYRRITNRDDNQGVFQIHVLLADLEANTFEFIVWKPAGATYAGTSSTTIIGSNAAGGVIAFSQLTGPVHWVAEFVLTPVQASGSWILTSSTNSLQDFAVFTSPGTPPPYPPMTPA